MILNIKIIPNSSINEIIQKDGNSWKIKIKSPAIENKANIELIAFLSKKLHIPKSLIVIKKGLTSKTKTVQLTID